MEEEPQWHKYLIVEARDYEVNNLHDSIELFKELYRIATEDYPGMIPIFRLHYDEES